MPVAIVDLVDRLRRPEYTGENRCTPCTVTNTLIALVLSAVVAWIVAVRADAGVAGGAAAAVAVFGVSTALIALRGYLVPGTPELTKRYFPPWLLRLFGKAERPAPPEADDVDVEERLLAAGALAECDDVDDLCLAGEFERAWNDRIEVAREEDAGRDALAGLLDVDGNEFSFHDHGGAFTASRGNARVGKWESRAAFVADVAAAELLADRLDGWDGLSVAARSRLLGGLRLFLERCPSCGADLALGEETVESCCSTVDVVAVTCEACDARVFEAEYDGPAAGV